nr:MAG TPA: hypothetical protein [Caudoviricetes sp.]
MQEFNQKHLVLFQNLKEIEQEKKKLETTSKKFKEELLNAMLEHGVKSIDNDFVKVTVTKASESVSVDLKELQKKEPRLYGELLEDYPKVTKRAESIRVTVK